MRVSIIIPGYNSRTTLDACLTACLCQTWPDVEVIVVDDGSTDDTGAIAQAYPIRYYRQDNQGPAAARNRGAGMATGTVLVFTDADCIPQPDWVARLVAWLDDAHPAVGGTYGIANPESLLARLVHEEIVQRHAGFGREVDFLGSFNMAYRRDFFLEIGGFNESYRSASGEDNDLSYRVLAAGARLAFTRDAVVAHHHPTRYWGYWRTQARHGYWRVKLYADHPARAGSGDRYAGLADLAAPACALVAGATVPMAVVLGPVIPWVWMIPSVAALITGVLHIPLCTRIIRRTRDGRMAALLPIQVVRDLFRGVGMVVGTWQFVLTRKAHP